MPNEPQPLPNEPFENIIARIARVPSERIETREIVVRREPRISALKLAEYVIADPSRQKTIVKTSKFARKAVMLQYTKARSFVHRAFTDSGIDATMLSEKAAEIEAEAWNTTWQKEDNRRSAEALRRFANMAPQFQWQSATEIPKPFEGWGHIMLAGVKVSVQPEVVFQFDHRNITKVGAILLNVSIKDEKSLSRSNGGYSVGDYLSSLLFQTLLQKFSTVGAPLNSKCVAVDVYRGTIHEAPKSYKTLNKHLEAACETIALRWPQIEG